MGEPTIRSEIMRQAGKRREKRLKVALNDEEYAKLMEMALEKDLTLAELIRHKVFKDV